MESSVKKVKVQMMRLRREGNQFNSRDDRTLVTGEYMEVGE